MKGIIFGPESVQAILDGRKTVTRRPMKPQPPGKAYMAPGEPCDYPLIKVRYQPGEILYVKEVWRNQPLGFNPKTREYSDYEYQYRADFSEAENALYGRRGGIGPFKWRHPMFMPQEASRLFIKIVAIRAERLWDITPEDCIAAGVMTDICQRCISNGGHCRPQLAEDIFCGGEDGLIDEYACLWDKLNPKNPWNSDPWVWVYTFEGVEKP